MTLSPRTPSSKISVLVSDVDGTLVTDDKVLTEGTQRAVADLNAHGVIFAIISSRPPRGLRMLIEPLRIKTPICGFNGGVIASPDLSVIREHHLAPDIARLAVDLLGAQDIQIWIFSGQDWLLRDPKGSCVGHEEHTIGFCPTVVKDFGKYLDTANKIVGVSQDFKVIEKCECDVQAALVGGASVVRSQSCYLDITHPLANKGAALSELANLFAIPLEEIAVIGDGYNDVAMFERSGLSIALGNASLEVRQAADFVTDSNHDDGFAKAVQRFIIGGVRLNGQAGIARPGATA
jgi:Cof subfamily protein (haloacid dehalogenase superfamily)